MFSVTIFFLSEGLSTKIHVILRIQFSIVKKIHTIQQVLRRHCCCSFTANLIDGNVELVLHSQ